MYLIVLICLATLAFIGWLLMIRMPGRSHSGPLPPLDDATRAIMTEVEADVRELAGTIGERSALRATNLEAAAKHVERAFTACGLAPKRQTFAVETSAFANVWAEIEGGRRASEIVIVGAHYDSVANCPGANDNASGVAAMLALARRLAASKPERTLRFVALVNEEPPHFQTDAMGSAVFAKAAKRAGEDVVAMLSLETLGCYSDAPGSQDYPIGALKLAYPSRGNFVAFVGNVASRALVREALGEFRASCAFPSEGAALPAWIPGVGWSDQWAFWEQGFAALMITDTAPFRFREYHTPRDVPEVVDFEKLARVTSGLVSVVTRLANRRP
jgi:hypothetical protein